MFTAMDKQPLVSLRLPPTFSLLRVLPVWTFATIISAWAVYRAVRAYSPAQ